MDHGVHIDWEPVESMAEKAVKEGWIAEIGVSAATIAVFGWIVYAIHKAMQSYQAVGSTLSTFF
jgi:hypothetical protein